MAQSSNLRQPQEIVLNAGAQVIVNGALVTVRDPCRIEVGSGAVVLTGRALWRDRINTDLASALYFGVLEASADEGGLTKARFALFELLGRVVAQNRTHEAQRECALFAAAVLSGDAEAAIGSARRLNRGEWRQQPVPRPTNVAPDLGETAEDPGSTALTAPA